MFGLINVRDRENLLKTEFYELDVSILKESRKLLCQYSRIADG